MTANSQWIQLLKYLRTLTQCSCRLPQQDAVHTSWHNAWTQICNIILCFHWVQLQWTSAYPHPESRLTRIHADMHVSTCRVN